MEHFAVILIKHGIAFEYEKRTLIETLINRKHDLIVSLAQGSVIIKSRIKSDAFLTQPEDIKEAAEFLESICEHLNK